MIKSNKLSRVSSTFIASVVVFFLPMTSRAAEPPYFPVNPKQLLDAMPISSGWEVSVSSGATTRGNQITTTARKEATRTVEIEGESVTYIMELEIVDTGGKSGTLVSLERMQPANEPDLLITKKGGQTVMKIFSEGVPPFYQTSLFDRFVINMTTDVPEKQAIDFLSPASYPKLRSAPRKSVPENLRSFQEIHYNELDPSRNRVIVRKFMTEEEFRQRELEEEILNPDALSGIEEDQLSEEEIQRSEAAREAQEE
ncbi:MAG: hypothetical protein AAGA58_06980 [Verrucomicrobiota bacterium]